MLRKFSILAVLSAILLSPLAAYAHGSAVGIVKERMDLMKFIGQNTKLIAPIAMGSADMNLKAVESAAKAISEAAAKAAAKFPEHSTSMTSEAKPNIWENWAEFEGLLNKLSQDAAKLSQMAKDEEEFELIDQFGKMANNCKTCHTKFRQKKQ